MNPIHTEALRLESMGYHVVPFSARRKLTDPSKPLVPDYIKTKPDISLQIRMDPVFDIAILPIECCVLDLEMKNGLDGISDLTKLAAQNGMTWEQVTNGCFLTKTKSNGLHVWYRQPGGERLVGGLHIRPGIEGKAVNGTVHVPPSLGYVASVPIGASRDLPELPGFIADAWRACGKKRGEKLDTQISLYPIGQRRQYLLSYAGTLREQSGASVEELAALLRNRRDSHCEDPGSFSDEEVFSIAKDIGRKEVRNIQGAALAGDAAAQSVLAIIKNAKKEDDEPVIIVEDEKEEQELIDPLYAPPWCEPTPMFKMFQDWCRAAAVKFQPETNLLVAACTFGCIMGRTYAGPSGLRANLYAVSLLPTASGKELPKVCGEHLLELLDRGICIGRQFGSDSGMIKELAKSPEMLWFCDEFHGPLRAWANPGTSSYFTNIKDLFLSCWLGHTFRGKSLKDMEEAPSVSKPHPCLMAFCQPSTFRKYCTDELISSGFLNRFLYTTSDKYTYETGPGRAFDSCVPEGLVPLIKSRLSETTALMKLQNLSGNIVFPFAKGAEEEIKLLKLENEHRSAQFYKESETKCALSGRASELALRLALIHAWTLGLKEVTTEGFKWGMEVALHSQESIFSQIETAGASTDHEKLVNSVLDKIKRFPGITKARLTSLNKSATVNQLDSALTTLLNGGTITCTLNHKRTNSYHYNKEKP